MLLNFWRKIAATGNGHRFAFLLRKNDSSHQCLHWWQQMSTGHPHLDGFDSSAETTNGTPIWGVPFVFDSLSNKKSKNNDLRADLFTI